MSRRGAGPGQRGRRGQGGRRGRRGERGFTLIELMIALAISSILVMMVLSVFSRMSSAYRRQQQVAELQGILSAAQNLLAQDARQAGFQLADGFRLANVANPVRPVRIVNSSTAPDEVYFFSADAAVQSRVITIVGNTSITVDSHQFVDGELAVIVNTATTTVTVAGVGRVIPQFTACVVRVGLTGSPGTINLSQTPPWGETGNLHCNDVNTAHVSGTAPGQTMIYRFRARGYRIDPTRPALGVLQLSASGGLVANDWQDLGIGFADLQVAAEMFLASAGTDVDGDGNAQYNWWSGAAMQTNTDNGALYRITRLTLSVSARTDRTVDGVATATTPAFIDAARPQYNNLGDRPSVVLDPSDRVYRYTSNRIDLRNAGVGL